MTRFVSRLLVSSAFAASLAATAQAAPRMVPMGGTADVQGNQVACSGVGDRGEQHAQMADYPIKLEFVGSYGQFLGNERLVINGRNGMRLNVRCRAPWVMMSLPPGHYRATAYVPGAASKDISFTVPRRGVRHIVVRYRSITEGKPNRPENAVYRGNEIPPAQSNAPVPQ